MHVMGLLEQWLQPNAIIGHRAKVSAVVRVVDALLNGGKLALTRQRGAPGQAPVPSMARFSGVR